MNSLSKGPEDESTWCFQRREVPSGAGHQDLESSGWELRLARLRESGPRRPLHVRGRVVKEFVSCWCSWTLAGLKDHLRSWPLNEAGRW